MSAQSHSRRITVPDIRGKKGVQPIVSLTAYSALTARFVDPHADIILVGDSLAMVEHGMETTLGATLDLMIFHAQSVMRASKRALVVVDLPFGSYEASPQDAYRSASRVLSQTGCSAVKLEGGAAMAPTVEFLTSRGVPVMGHIGLTPQSVMGTGGFKTQGRDRSTWEVIKQDAVTIENSGAFAIVLEGIVEPLARAITNMLKTPTIGIGASSHCDGQILVLEDMLGFNPKVPRFVKKFGTIGDAVDKAIAEYAASVLDRSFPGLEHTYEPKD
ncbi:3-methyl-2-oxobutanoate hydroxymethyltransferase (plasmid) [Agrobacterium sp. rho-13.3]|uniref:3-methyl-2-oxobutanoate hydroxymethyltransferase n=1 Tax=Agrobacterium sp. rho-13.3 TaxID=3072980 RepID=UPI002A0E7B81|nr:3-methyl-2-oxobutanoate hydroxymethyltransferase [Agrobacterium sp. rho-13.3]MDX8310275.1 3-methyl-2-oxobutanoate hydroxymethyltransferase [Agrobacterium sp. rho-13.3]